MRSDGILSESGISLVYTSGVLETRETATRQIYAKLRERMAVANSGVLSLVGNLDDSRKI